MDPSQSEPRMELPISIQEDSLQYDTNVCVNWLNSTYEFCGSKIFKPKGLVGKCIHGPKIIVYNVHGHRDTQCFLLTTVSLTMLSLSQKTFLFLVFYVLLHLKCVEFVRWVTNNERLECVHSTF